jgi:hypothetical protein
LHLITPINTSSFKKVSIFPCLFDGIFWQKKAVGYSGNISGKNGVPILAAMSK